LTILGSEDESLSGYRDNDALPSKEQVRKAADRLREGNLPGEFVDKFINLNGQIDVKKI
jgi:hypothetical protein